ncbi:MAG TPA: hypothetical protein DHU75_03140 [Rikenellaceae bacterium]|nr:hypothetical protein [Rikenellaceae bacterium]
MAVTTGKINNLAVTKEKLSRELQDNLGTKAYVVDYGCSSDIVENVINVFKGDPNKSSIFIRLDDGALLFAHLKSDTLTTTTTTTTGTTTPGTFNVSRYGYNLNNRQWYVQTFANVVRSGVSFEPQDIKSEYKAQARENIDAATKAYVITYAAGKIDTNAIIDTFEKDQNKSILYMRIPSDNLLLPVEIKKDTVTAATTTKVVSSQAIKLLRYVYTRTSGAWYTQTFDNIAANGVTYGEAQALTDSQKQQARENIEAMPDITIDLDAIEGVWDDTFGPTDFAYPYNDLDDSKYDTKRKVVMDYIFNKLTEMGLLHTEGENSSFSCMPYGHTLHFRLTTKVDGVLISLYADNVLRRSSTDIAQWGLRFSNPYSGLFIEQDPVKGFDYGAFLAGTGFGLSTPSAESTDIAIWCSGEAEFVRNNVMSALQACRPLCLAVAEDIYTDEEKEKGREILNTIDKAAFLTDAEVNDIWDNN